jgi:hypothetical protein
MTSSNKKKLLFLCSPFFGYYKHIIIELEKLGFDVEYFNDRPSESQIQKGIIRLFPFFAYSMIVTYFMSLIRKTKNTNYDIILIINNKVLTEDFLLALHQDHPNSYYIFYTWDSIHLYPSTVNHLSYFDVAYSFDSSDCKLVNGLTHLSLFYTHKHNEVGKTLTTPDDFKSLKFDVSSIGTAHPNRYAVLKDLIPYLKKKNLSVFCFQYIQFYRFLFNRLFIPEFKRASHKNFSFTELSDNEIAEIFKQSKAILDIPHFGQSGLTMRTIETLGAKRKLITYNKNVKNYNFYNENNILILNNNNWDAIDQFLEKDFIQIDQGIYDQYSITNWTKRLIETWKPKDQDIQDK